MNAMYQIYNLWILQWFILYNLWSSVYLQLVEFGLLTTCEQQFTLQQFTLQLVEFFYIRPPVKHGMEWNVEWNAEWYME